MSDEVLGFIIVMGAVILWYLAKNGSTMKRRRMYRQMKRQAKVSKKQTQEMARIQNALRASGNQRMADEMGAFYRMAKQSDASTDRYLEQQKRDLRAAQRGGRGGASGYSSSGVSSAPSSPVYSSPSSYCGGSSSPYSAEIADMEDQVQYTRQQISDLDRGGYAIEADEKRAELRRLEDDLIYKKGSL